MIRATLTLVLVSGLSLIPDQSFAQSLFGNNSALSQSGTSGFGAASSTAGRVSGTGGLGATGAGGLGATGLNTGGAAAAGNTQFGQTNIQTQLGELSNSIGQGFIGQSDNVGRFVGGNLATQQGAGGAQNVQGNFNQGGGRGAGQSFNEQNRGNQGTQARQAIRPRFKVAFDYTPRAATRVQSVLVGRMDRIKSRRAGLEGIDIEIGDGGKVTLNGNVGTEDQRKFAEALARLEPGVRSVKNNIKVRAE